MRRNVRSLIVSSALLATTVVMWPAAAHAQFPPFRYSRYSDESSLRVQVQPREAQVFVDGYFAGVVDSFDGTFQRLRLRPGGHVIEIFHDGYRTITEKMLFQPGQGYTLRRSMEPLGPGDPAPARPSPDPSAPRAEARDPYFEPRDVRPEARGQAPGVDSGSVAIRVQPAGAVILIDGEKWDAPVGNERLVVHLSEGNHRVEIQKEGYRSFATEVRIRRGETVPLNISLRMN